MGAEKSARRSTKGRSTMTVTQVGNGTRVPGGTRGKPYLATGTASKSFNPPLTIRVVTTGCRDASINGQFSRAYEPNGEEQVLGAGVRVPKYAARITTQGNSRSKEMFGIATEVKQWKIDVAYAGKLRGVGFKGNDVGMACGTARFDFHALNVDTGDDFVMRGERACVLAVSNRVTRELSDRAGKLTVAIVSAFSEEIADHLAGEAAETAAQKRLKKQGKKYLKKLFPTIAKGVKRGVAIERIGDAAVALMVPYAAGKHLQHVKAYHGCTRLLLDVDDGKLKSGGLLYSPDGLHNAMRDDYLTYVSVYAKRVKSGGLDEFVRQQSGLHCNDEGMIDNSVSNGALFSDATSAVWNAEPEDGFEPTTYRLQGGCSGQLSYSGGNAQCRRRRGQASRVCDRSQGT